MSSKKHLQLAYGLAIVLLVVGAGSYAYTAFTATVLDEPVRIQYRSVAGKVLFSHKMHSGDSGYGFACYDCHHHPSDDESSLRACGDCHQGPLGEGVVLESCLECHDRDEVEETEITKKGDAFHHQCIQCHQEFEAGPEECSQCHVL